MSKMLRRYESDAVVYGRDLNRLMDSLIGNEEGRISLLDDSGDELDLHSGAVVSSNNYAFKARSAAGRHGLYQHSSGTPDILDIRDSGVTANALTVTGAAAFNGNTTIGDAAGDTLTVNATSTFVAAASFNGNVTLGDASADTLTVEATATFKANVSFLVNVTIGDAAGDTLTVNSTPTFNVGLTVATGVLSIPAGTAGAPSLAVGEATTGLYRVSAGILGFTISGTERARLSSTTFDVTGDVEADRIRIATTSFSGTEELRVVGQTRLEGALTVTTGGISNTGLITTDAGSAAWVDINNPQTAGTAGALIGYLYFKLGGSDVKVPYYNT